MSCKACKKDHNPMLTCQRAARLAVPVEPPVNTMAAVVNTKADRHREGYMREYMRKRRAEAKKAKEVE